MRTRPRPFLLSLLVVALWVTTSNVLTVCVHEGHLGLEAAWATCCETAACCEEAAPAAAASDHAHLASAPDGCRDFTLSLGGDWAPDDGPGLVFPGGWGLQPLRPAPYGALPREDRRSSLEPRGVPPPQRPHRSPILRC